MLFSLSSLISSFLSLNVFHPSSDHVEGVFVIFSFPYQFLPLSIFNYSSCIFIILHVLVFSLKLPIQNLCTDIATAVFGLINPIPAAFFLENKAPLGNFLLNLEFLAIVVSCVFSKNSILLIFEFYYFTPKILSSLNMH